MTSIAAHKMEIAFGHPQVGFNLYVLASISDAPIGEVIRGILPFLLLLLSSGLSPMCPSCRCGCRE
jgi:TRAP-type C4-dicarboxylate transport system permease large subunit